MDLSAGYPLALIRNGLVKSYPKLERDIKTDVAVMGGGISGALAAWHLVRSGVSCIVMDGRTIGLGSTCASTSLLQYEIDTPLSELENKIGVSPAQRAYACCDEAIDKLRSIAGAIGFTGIKKKPSLYYAAFKKDIPFLQREYQSRKEAGFNVRYLDEEALWQHTGIAAPAAILSSQAAETNAYLFTHALLQDAVKGGLQVFDRTPVERIRHYRNGVELFTAGRARISAKKLVYATGYEVVKYLDKEIVKLKSTYAVASESASQPRPFWYRDALLWNTADPYLYVRTTADNRIIVGGRDEDFYSPFKRDRLLKGKTRQLATDFRKLFPEISFQPEFSWTGTFGATSDGLPYIGSWKKLPNSYFALGFGGNGITFSLLAAEIITGLIKGRKPKDAGLFSFDR